MLFGADLNTAYAKYVAYEAAASSSTYSAFQMAATAASTALGTTTTSGTILYDLNRITVTYGTYVTDAVTLANEITGAQTTTLPSPAVSFFIRLLLAHMLNQESGPIAWPCERACFSFCCCCCGRCAAVARLDMANLLFTVVMYDHHRHCKTVHATPQVPGSAHSCFATLTVVSWLNNLHARCLAHRSCRPC